MKKHYLLAALLACGLAAKAQQLTCGNPNENRTVEVNRLARLQNLKQLKSTQKLAGEDITYVAVKMHLFGTDAGTGYADGTDVNNALAILNREYKAIGVQFYFSGTDFDYIDNTSVYGGTQPSNVVSALQSAHGVNNAINMYVPQTVTSGGSIVGGWSYITPYAQIYNQLWLDMDQINIYDGKTTLHEVGHYFGLLHTFNDSDNADEGERELVTRNFIEPAPRLGANCDVNGDYLCDTPSDPYNLDGADVENCVYTGEVTDLNGDTFLPQLTNIMSYYWCLPNTFTTGQIARMADGKLLVTNADNFTLDAPATTQAVPTNITAANNDPDYFGTVTVSWTDNSAVETGFIIERATSPDGDFTAAGGVKANSTTFLDMNMLPNTTYYYRVKASNTKDGYSAVSGPVTTPLTCANSNGQTCQLNASADDAAWYIESFRLQNQLDVLANEHTDCSENGITNYFNSYAMNVAPGDLLEFNVKSKAATNGAAYNIVVSLYADWNRDGDFEDENELVYNSTELSFYQVTGYFNVPQIVGLGNIRLRVMMSADSYIPGPCALIWGEIEDYKLVNTVLATENVSAESFAVYPNPASSILNIQAPQNITVTAIGITDITGKKILEQKGGSTVNVASLSNGIYLLQLTTEAGTFTRKFIKE